MSTVNEIRSCFPVLSRKVYGKDLVYFDNAATSQRPQSVIDKWNEISAQSNANIHRAVHCLADEATQAYEASRDAVRGFINAGSREEIVFTSGATQSINLVAFCFGTIGGLMMAKLLNVLSGGKINPLIGSAGVSAVPMAARVSQKVGQEYDPGNYLLMHAMGPNVAGVIGSAVAAGVLLACFG